MIQRSTWVNAKRRAVKNPFGAFTMTDAERGPALPSLHTVGVCVALCPTFAGNDGRAWAWLGPACPRRMFVQGGQYEDLVFVWVVVSVAVAPCLQLAPPMTAPPV